MRQGGTTVGCVGAVCLLCVMLGCDASTASLGQAPSPVEPVVGAQPHRTSATAAAVSSPGTALMAVRLTKAGGVSVGAVRPKPVAWHGALSPYTPPAGLAAAGTGGDDVRAGPPGVGRAPRATHAPGYLLAVVARAPGRPALARTLLLDAPGHGHGDVVDPWTTGGAVWRLPWFGPKTTYEVVRVSPRPEVLARWPAR